MICKKPADWNEYCRFEKKLLNWHSKNWPQDPGWEPDAAIESERIHSEKRWNEQDQLRNTAVLLKWAHASLGGTGATCGFRSFCFCGFPSAAFSPPIHFESSFFLRWARSHIAKWVNSSSRHRFLPVNFEAVRPISRGDNKTDIEISAFCQPKLLNGGGGCPSFREPLSFVIAVWRSRTSEGQGRNINSEIAQFGYEIRSRGAKGKKPRSAERGVCFQFRALKHGSEFWVVVYTARYVLIENHFIYKWECVLVLSIPNFTFAPETPMK